MQVFVIHAVRLVERRASITGQLNAAGIPFEWVTAETGFEEYFASPSPLSPRQVSCSVKHLAALARVAETALILEDDAVLAGAFSIRLGEALAELAREPPLSVAYLDAGDHWYTPRHQLRRNRTLYPAASGRTTNGYLITPEAARARLRWLRQHPMHTPIGHAFNEADAATGVRIWWAEPPLTHQGSFSGRFDSAIHAKRPRWQQAIYFAYRGLVRRAR